MEMMLREQRAMEQMKVVEKKEAVQAMHREMREKTCCPHSHLPAALVHRPLCDQTLVLGQGP